MAMTASICTDYDWHPFTRSGGVTVTRHICTWDGLFAISRKIPNCYEEGLRLINGLGTTRVIGRVVGLQI